jgi:cell division protein FtsL
MTRRRKKARHTEFHTVKRIDNSRLVRHVEPARQRDLLKTAGLGAIVAVFLMMYVYQHFRCIDLSFQLEDLKSKQTQLAALNSELRLEIAGLRDPRRIDLIARRRLGLTEALPTQVQQYESMPNGAEVASVRYLRTGHAR